MRCINVIPLKPSEGDRPYQKHYNALFDAVGLNKTGSSEKIYCR